MPHQHQTRVDVTLAPVAAAELERGQAAISRGRRCPESGGVLVERLASAGGIECPGVSLLVVAVDGAGPAAPLFRGGAFFALPRSGNGTDFRRQGLPCDQKQGVR